MGKTIILLIEGLLCIGVGIFLTYGLQYVDTNLNWYIGYMSFAYLVGVITLVSLARNLRNMRG